MRFAILGCALFAATALSSPLRQRDVVTDNVVVTDEVIVTVTVNAGSNPAPSPAASSVVKVAVPYDNNDNNWDGYTWSWTHSTHTPTPASSSSAAPQPSSPTTTAPSTTSTALPTNAPPPPPPTTTTTPPPPPPSTSSTSSSSSSTSSAAPISSAPASDGSPKSGGVSMLSTVNKWRKAYSLSDLAWDSTLEGNAQKTGTDGKGVNQNHELNPGSMAQVITPGLQTALAGKDMGGDSPFELAYVSWLCEVASDPQLANGNQCGIVKNIENMRYSDTGHYDILNSPSYSKIGCAFAANPLAASDSPYQGLWVCDLA